MPGRWVTVKGRAVYIEDKPGGTVAVAERPKRRRSDLAEMHHQSKQRAKERERREKAATWYGVFPHSIDGEATGRGYVARPTDESGHPHDTRNYGKAIRSGKLYRQRKAAERAAEAKSEQVASDERTFRSHQ